MSAGEVGLYFINYYKRKGRKYPWRDNRSPFKVYLSEMLLQRTQADQVTPVYNRLIGKFDSVLSLITGFEEATAIMQPLGRFCRLNYFKEGLEYLNDHFGGEIPEDNARLARIPGVGPYIAAAIRIFGFDINDAIIDTNVVRVIGRIYGLERTPETRRKKSFIELARRHVPQVKCVEYSYGILDFAATVCRSRGPLCNQCGLTKLCISYTSNSNPPRISLPVSK